MLLKRVITAVLLLAVIVSVLLSKQVWAVAALGAVVLLTAGWEWGRLQGLRAPAAWGLGCVLLGLATAWIFFQEAAHASLAVWLGMSGAWLLGGGMLLSAGPPRWLDLPLMLRVALALVALVPAVVAFGALLDVGLNALFSTLSLVWVADIAAYFGGKALGRHKLAPVVSPGKTWEGAVCGGAGALTWAWAWHHWVDAAWLGQGPSLYGHLVSGFGVWKGVAALLLLVVLAVMGDLLESLLKRAVGAKDSSGLLPGHGGVLDRIDALLPVLPAALALAALAGPWR